LVSEAGVPRLFIRTVERALTLLREDSEQQLKYQGAEFPQERGDWGCLLIV